MSEKTLFIPAPDGKIISAKLEGEWGADLVVLVHGLGSGKNTMLAITAAEYFFWRQAEGEQLPCLRFNLFDDEKGARRLDECTLETHASDLAAVLAHAETKGVERIHLVGHSMAGYTVFAVSNPRVASLTLWDPSDPEQIPLCDAPKVAITEPAESRQTEGYRLEDRVDWLLPSTYAESILAFSLEAAMAGWRPVPTLFVTALNGEARAEKYAGRIPRQEVEVVCHAMPGADHSFTAYLDRQELFNVTRRWLMQHGALQ